MAPSVSADTQTLWNALPQFVQDQDTANGWPFLSWLEGPGSILQTIDDLARDDDLGNPGWSSLLDVTRCPTYALPWLAQFVGVRFSSSQLTDAQQRAAITAEQGFQRGTVAAIEAAGNALLSSGSVMVLERTPDPYSLTVEVPTSGLTGGTWGALVAEFATWTTVISDFSTWADVSEQSAAIEAAILAAIPAGLVTTITFV